MKVLVFNGEKILYQSGYGFDDVVPNSKEGATKLIVDLKKEISKLEKIVDKFDRETVITDNGRLTFYTSDIQTIEAFKFYNGLASFEMNLGDEFSVHKTTSINSLCFRAASDIYYKDTLLIPRGGKIGYYRTVQTWAEEQFKDNIARVVLDLRPDGVYGSDFDQEFLHNNKGEKGKSFYIRLYAEYKYPVT